ncbi:hypothetical protein CMV_030748 [Castanea mollissima]|uniref:Uncharacterized protein n=1 Tax=Castanea mollissima TaxID=60419 RepID=A0A8J4V9I3_9ROSI|nr:hypothetical protein CMV_030748 [Castanea mollissima]
MDTLLPSLQILDIASCQQVESFLKGLPTNMNCLAIDASALPKGSSGVRKDCSLLINYYCLVMIVGKRSAFLRRTSTNEIKSHLTISSKCHKRLGQTHARRAVNKTIAKEEGKIVVKDWSHLLHKNGCPNPNQGVF